MPRKRCSSLVEQGACSRIFCPLPVGVEQQILVGMDELEALRLKDVEGINQAECATRMGLTRTTFQRVLYSARAKVAQALVEGSEICIKGGNYQISSRGGIRQK